ncbi:type 11 methyltransferase [Clostridium carnis]|uniref:Type 11 methyltransferase n=1 Tax=Clostridium carnis TaxID=1530 RepID=A0ABY6SP80_9CLOT|nr:type 11 methyltransferase [Clostridium carnis]
MLLKETGERQVKYYLRDIDKDHRNRYIFASQLVRENDKVADIGCGVGYGSYYIAMSTPCKSVLGIDIDKEAIEFAKEKYVTDKNKFEQRDIITEKNNEKFNFIIAFEVVEHVPDSQKFLESCESMLEDDGIIVLTTPNENVLNFNPEIFKFHQRHYTPEQLKEKLNSTNLEVIGMYSQNDERIFKTTTNAYNVFVCKKKQSKVQLPVALEEEITGFEKAASEINKLEWYVKHAPRMNYEVCCKYLSDVYVSLANIEDLITADFEKHRRKFTPEYFGDMFDGDDVIGPLKSMDTINQTILAKALNFCGIAIRVATYCKEFKGQIMLSLKDCNEKTIAYKLFEDEEICDNKWLEMKFPLIKNSAKQKYVIEINILKIKGDSQIGVYQNSKIKCENLLMHNNVDIIGNLSYRMLYN